MNLPESPHRCTNKRFRLAQFPNYSTFPRKKSKHTVSNTASIQIKTFNVPLISSTTNTSLNLIRLQPYRPYTIGRSRKRCEFVFEDRRVSKSHCQILFDASDNKIYIADGVFFVSYGECCSRVRVRVRVSLNGVFVNGVRIGNDGVVELHAGDEVSLVCENEGVCSMGRRIGFLVERIAFVEEIVDRNVSNIKKDVLGLGNDIFSKADLLLSRCREILSKDDPMLYIQKMRPKYLCRNIENNNSSLVLCSAVKFAATSTIELPCGAVACREELLHSEGVAKERNSRTKLDGTGELNLAILHREVNSEQERGNITGNNLQQNNAKIPFEICFANYKVAAMPSSIISPKETLVISEGDCDPNCCNVNGEYFQQIDDSCVPCQNGIANSKHVVKFIGYGEEDEHAKLARDKSKGFYVPRPPPGKKFYLNRLQYMSHSSTEHDNVVSLPELLYPVETLVRVFMATFTSDIPWFLSYCEIPAHLPVTIACHSAGRCWSSSLDDRTSVPYSDFPNLVVVYPPFPEAIAFGQDRKKLGIACHHPKFIVLQREDSIRVVITSANLVPKQWHVVTNTVWWQDFPRLSTPDYLSLFTQSTYGEVNQDSKSDFAAQLAKFMALLVTDVPSQAHWILELPKYDFKEAVGHLVASIPGIHSPRIPFILESRHILTGIPGVSGSCGLKLLGSVEASVVGLSHLFRTSADSNGSQLKRLAAFLGKCHENTYGLSEIVLRRNTNIPADANAVSVLIPNPKVFSEEDCIQLGFLPRNIAKWVAPLSDSGLFAFSAYIYRKDALASALEGSNNKVQLILYVSQGPCFMDMAGVTQSFLVSAICLLVSSIQRSAGLWRLREVLGHYKWPEYSETDFVFGSSSVGSVNAQFLAAFSAAAGKRSLQFSESEESDPDWGCWSASQESRNPSIRIIFPTIERVMSASCGILASKYLLCFSQKTWLRLRNVGIVHDAIPYPKERVGHPMHVKVGLRRFQSKTDTSSCGWVYCGSHNFSAAAWGRPISNSSPNGVVRTNNPVLGWRLHICNYELGIIFIVPPSDTKNNNANKVGTNLDEIVLPFVVPAPKYKPRDRPATAQAMREALAQLTELERKRYGEAEIAGDLMEEEEMPDEEDEVLEVAEYVMVVEKEDEKAYAEKLWSQVDSSQSC